MQHEKVCGQSALKLREVLHKLILTFFKKSNIIVELNCYILMELEISKKTSFYCLFVLLFHILVTWGFNCSNNMTLLHFTTQELINYLTCLSVHV